MEMVTLQQAKDHLRITTPDGHPDDADLDLKLMAATLAVRRFVGRSTFGLTFIEQWQTPETTDKDAAAAVLLVLGELWRFRGDDPGAVIYSPGRDPGADFSPAVIGLLRRFSDPVLA